MDKRTMLSDILNWYKKTNWVSHENALNNIEGIYTNMTAPIKFKRLHPNAKLPEYATARAAGADLFACNDKPITLYLGESVLIPLGFSMEIPEHYGAFLLPRSGLGHKTGLVLGNLVGLVDADYRGQVFVSAWNRNRSYQAITINPDDRIAQMCIIEARQWPMQWVDELDETERGAGGFGSSGI